MRIGNRIVTLSLAIALGSSPVAPGQDTGRARADRDVLRLKFVRAAESVFRVLHVEMGPEYRRQACAKLGCSEEELPRASAVDSVRNAEWIDRLRGSEVRAMLAGSFDERASRRRVSDAVSKLRKLSSGLDGPIAVIAKRAQKGEWKGIELEFVSRALWDLAVRLEEIDRKIRRLERESSS